MSFTSRAIVLSREDFGEADRYVQFLTRDWGVISVLAKAARKSQRRYVGGLDLFCHDQIFLRGDPRERPYLIELTVLNSFQELRQSFDKMMMAGKAAQWVKKLVPAAAPVPSVYSLLGQIFALLEREDDPVRMEALSVVFRMKLLSQLGIRPQIDSCVKCEETENPVMVFDFGAGGVVCNACHLTLGEGQFEMASEDLPALQLAEVARLAEWAQVQFPIARVRPLSVLLTHFASYHSHVRLPL